MALIRLALVTVLSLAFTPVAAQDFQKGYDALQAGDYATAVHEWKPLAEAGDANAQRNLGLMYDTGTGVPQDDKEAVKWYRLAADQGGARAQFELGVKYQVGLGVLQNHDKALMWYQLAAKQGHADAQNQLGNIYVRGDGVPASYVMAFMWYSISSANGNRAASNLRDKASAVLSSEELSQGRFMAQECMSSGYKQCGY